MNGLEAHNRIPDYPDVDNYDGSWILNGIIISWAIAISVYYLNI